MQIESIEWNQQKNEQLQRTRGVSFERVASLLLENAFLDVYDHPDQERYPRQQVVVIEMDDYVYLVPFIQEGGRFFLKTIIPSRKAKRKYRR